jgi:hypothetical protein
MLDAETPYRHSADLALTEFGYDKRARGKLLERIATSDNPVYEVWSFLQDRLVQLLRDRNYGKPPGEALYDTQTAANLLFFAMHCARQQDAICVPGHAEPLAA